MKTVKGITSAQILAKARHEFEHAADAYALAVSKLEMREERLADLGRAALAFSRAKRDTSRDG